MRRFVSGLLDRYQAALQAALRLDPEQHFDVYLRARVLVLLSVIHAVSGLALAVEDALSVPEFSFGKLVGWPSILFFMALPFLVLKLRSVSTVAVIYLATLIGGIWLVAIPGGGIRAPIVIFLSATPLIAAFLLTGRAFIYATVIVVISLLSLYAITLSGITFGALENRMHLHLLCAATASVATASSAYGFIAINRERGRRLKLALASAKEAKRQKSGFIQFAAHELRTPMTGVLGMLDILAEMKLSKEAAEIVDLASRSARVLAATVDDLVDHASLEADNVRVQREQVRLKPILSDVLALAQARARSSDVPIDDADSQTADIMVITDAKIARQCLTTAVNVICGVKSLNDLHVETRVLAGAEPNQSVLSFRVFGGMSREHAAILLNRARHGDLSIEDRNGLNDLAYLVGQKLAKLLGGVMQIEQFPDLRVGVVVQLPLEKSDMQAPTDPVGGERDSSEMSIAASFAAPDPSFQAGSEQRDLVAIGSDPAVLQRWALLVDDNDVHRSTIEAIAAEEDIQLVVVYHGAMAVSALLQRPFEIVLINMSMPHLGGVETLRNMRALPRPLCDIGIAAIFAQSETPADAERAHYGIDAILAAPFDAPSIRAAFDACTIKKTERHASGRRRVA